MALSFSSTLVDTSPVWVFGYSSLCWNPGFTFQESRIGYVKGFSRKFWQGSVSHRGTATKPGRVATLIEDDKAIVWGRAFKITSESGAFQYLQTRECSNGGYSLEMVKFYTNGDENVSPIQALTFIAYSNNYLWLGESPLVEMSSQIVSCKGVAGYNAEYLLKLADYMRTDIPQETDVELFALEKSVLEHIQKQKLCLDEIMIGVQAGAGLEDEIRRRSNAEARPSTSINDFANRVPDKTLRCVNI